MKYIAVRITALSLLNWRLESIWLALLVDIFIWEFLFEVVYIRWILRLKRVPVGFETIAIKKDCFIFQHIITQGKIQSVEEIKQQLLRSCSKLALFKSSIIFLMDWYFFMEVRDKDLLDMYLKIAFVEVSDLSIKDDVGIANFINDQKLKPIPQTQL